MKSKLKPLQWKVINKNVCAEDKFNIFGIDVYIRYDICKSLDNYGYYTCCQFPNDNNVFYKALTIREAKDLCEERRNKFFSESLATLDTIYKNNKESYVLASLDEAISKLSSSSKKDNSILKYLKTLKDARNGNKVEFDINFLSCKINEYKNRMEDIGYSKIERDDFHSIVEWLDELKNYYSKKKD